VKFEDLEVWKRPARLSADIYKGIQQLKDYGFRDQLGRAGLSVPSNVAEGFERESIRECVNFLSYAKGSCGELRTQIYIGMDIGYIDRQQGQQWVKDSIEISSMLSGLIKTKRQHLSENNS
jgi:four helix bundle protein